MKLVVALFLVIVLAGCATSSGPTLAQSPIVVPDGKAVIVIYRVSSLTSAAYRHNMYLDGTLVARLPIGSYTHFAVDPGNYEVSSGKESNIRIKVVSVNANAGDTHYIAYDVGRNLSEPTTLRLVDKTVAERYLSGTYGYETPIGRP